MSKSELECRIIKLGRSKYRAKAWQYAARAQSVNDPERRAELLRVFRDLAEPNGALRRRTSGCARMATPLR